MLCKRCGKAEWVGPKFSRIPAPYPDPDNAGHYLPLSKTPRAINGKARAIDDLAPRGNIRKLFKDGSISSSNCEKLRTFSEEFCVEEKHVVSYVKYLEQLANVASIRERERTLNRTIEEGKQYQDYNWSDLIESGKLSKLKVKELDKYLKEHQLPSAGKKPDKLKRITADFYLRNDKEATSEDKPADPESDSLQESDSDDDDVLAVIGDSDTDEDSTVEPIQTTDSDTDGDRDTDEDSTVEPLQATETETCQFSRSGQRVGSWMSRYHENYV